MEYLIYIGAALAIGLLIGFVALAVIWLRKAMVKNVRSHTMGLLSVYDELLDEKSQELQELEEKLDHREEPVPQETPAAVAAGTGEGIDPGTLLSAAERAAATSYRDSSVGGVYRNIRENFSFQVEELLPALYATAQEPAGAAGRLLEQLDFDTVYHLSTLDPQEQVAVLRECLPEEGKALLADYLQTHRQFSALNFYDYLKSRAAAEPQGAKLYVPEGVARSRAFSGNVQVIADPEICEGFQAELGGKLYDYCIKTRDLS